MRFMQSHKSDRRLNNPPAGGTDTEKKRTHQMCAIRMLRMFFVCFRFFHWILIAMMSYYSRERPFLLCIRIRLKYTRAINEWKNALIIFSCDSSMYSSHAILRTILAHGLRGKEIRLRVQKCAHHRHTQTHSRTHGTMMITNLFLCST